MPALESVALLALQSVTGREYLLSYERVAEKRREEIEELNIATGTMTLARPGEAAKHVVAHPEPRNETLPRAPREKQIHATGHFVVHPSHIADEALAILRKGWTKHLVMYPMGSGGTLCPSHELEMGERMAAVVTGIEVTATIRDEALN